MTYTQEICEVLSQGDQCGPAVGCQEINTGKLRVVPECVYGSAVLEPRELAAEGSLCGDSVAMAGSLALFWSHSQDLSDSLPPGERLPKGRGNPSAQTVKGQSCITSGGRGPRTHRLIPSWLEDA